MGLLRCRLLGLGVPSLRPWPCCRPSGVGGRGLAVPVDHLPHRLHKRIALPNGVLRFEPGVQGLDELLLPESGVLPRSYFGELSLRQGWYLWQLELSDASLQPSYLRLLRGLLRLLRLLRPMVPRRLLLLLPGRRTGLGYCLPRSRLDVKPQV